MFFITLIGVLPVLCHSVAYGVDFPPVADAGPDITIHLPQTSVSLNGSKSYDDHGYLLYQWVKLTKDLSVDMMGTRTPLLQLSNLEQGDYTFKLTVTDSAGQSASKSVHVMVETVVCPSSDVHTLSGYRGVIDSSDYDPAPCTEWYITGPAWSNVTIRFTEFDLNEYVYKCDIQGDNYLSLGPLPKKTICGPLDDHSADKVYISERSHVWIKFVRNSAVYDRHFKLKYIASCEDTDFRCDNGRCIYQDWKCNGLTECGDWSDERNCDIQAKTTPTTKPAPIKSSPSPKPLYKSSAYRPSSCNTVYCYMSKYERDVCVASWEMCDGITQCLNGADEAKENCDAYTGNQSIKCQYGEVYCWFEGRQSCLPNEYKCDGKRQCYSGEDEDPALCGESSCSRRLESFTGWFVSPNFPRHYPNNKDCSWEIHVMGKTDTQIQLHFVTFSLQRDTDTDFVAVYDGPDKTAPMIGRYDGRNTPPSVISSTQSWMFVTFHSDEYFSFTGFNATYQMKGYCLQHQLSCGMGQDCFDRSKNCDGHWDCPNGGDENHCHNCQDGYFTCGPGTMQCYDMSERCNGMAKCSSNSDEEDCDLVQCGPHNGTFLCDNKRCIYESWTCDQRDDCGDYSDEKRCYGSSKRVIIAAISGSVICALLLTILIGCSCKLYSLRTIERHGGIRHHSPMSRLYAEFLRRTAPPPYHEAMLTSRNYDEVQQERRDRLRSQRRAARRRSAQENNSENNTAENDNQNTENPTENTSATERENLTFLNEVEITEPNDNTNSVPDTAENPVVTIDRSTEVTEDQNSDSDSDSDSSVDPEGIDHVNVIAQDGIEMQATGLSSRMENLDEHDESSDESCILNHPFDGDETSQNLDNQSISLDDISMETASASINLELTEISEETSVDNIENRDQDDPDKDIGCEQENLENMRRSVEPKEESSDVIGVGPSGRRNSQESLNSFHSNCTADSDEPLLVA